jgi:hypothetical protein
MRNHYRISFDIYTPENITEGMIACKYNEEYIHLELMEHLDGEEGCEDVEVNNVSIWSEEVEDEYLDEDDEDLY